MFSPIFQKRSFIEKHSISINSPKHFCGIDVLIGVRIIAFVTLPIMSIAPIHLLWLLIPSLAYLTIPLACLAFPLVCCLLVFVGVRKRKPEFLKLFYALTVAGIFSNPIALIFFIAVPHMTQTEFKTTQYMTRVSCLSSLVGVLFFVLAEIVTRRAIEVLASQRRLAVNNTKAQDLAWSSTSRAAERREYSSSLRDTVMQPMTEDALLFQHGELIFAIQPVFHNHHVPRMLPTTEMTQAEIDAADHCAICLEQWVLGEQVTKLACGHIYHPECIQRSLRNSDTCPFCRNRIDC